jgi:hypothetical protein
VGAAFVCIPLFFIFKAGSRDFSANFAIANYHDRGQKAEGS